MTEEEKKDSILSEEEKKESTLAEGNNKKLGKKKLIAIIISAVIVLGASLGIIIYNSQPSTKYAIANKAYENENYEKAAKYYEKAGDYEDASEKLADAKRGCLYAEGKDLLEEGKYDEAIGKFKESDSFKDAKDLIKKSYYEKGNSLKASGSYKDAAVAYIKAKKKEDAVLMAEELVKSGDYDDSIEIFKELNVDDPYYYYAVGQIEFKKHSYEKAAAYFLEAADILDANELYQESIYIYANMKVTKKNYSEAYELYKMIPDYKDVSEKQNECYFLYCTKLYNEGYLNTALKYLQDMPADYSYKGECVADYITLIENNSKWANLCGEWICTSGQMRTTEKGYRSYWWYRDFSKGDFKVEVTCHPLDDGYVHVYVNGTISVYTNYSTIREYLKVANYRIRFSEIITDYGTYEYDYYTTVTINDKGIKINYKENDNNRDVYFDYEYKTEITYGERKKAL